MNVAFFGTPEFALPALERLIHSHHAICLVVTRADKPKGRGQRVEAPPVKLLAQAHGLPIIQPKSCRREDVAGQIRQSGAEMAVVAAYGQILPKTVLEAPRLGCINLHPSLLPKYRGAAPIQRCILEGNTTTGITLIRLIEQMDAGPIIAQQRVEILPDDDASSVRDMCAVMGADMLMRVLDEAETHGDIESEPQDHEKATYAPPVRKEEGLIDWARSTEEIMFRIRAMQPWPGAYGYINGEKRLQIVQAEPLWPNEARALGEAANRAEPGTVSSIKKTFGFTVKTGTGHLLVTAVQPEGKGRMEASSFVNGRGIGVDDRLAPPGEG